MSEFHERFPPAHPSARIPQAVAEGLLCASLCVRTRTSQTAGPPPSCVLRSF